MFPIGAVIIGMNTVSSQEDAGTHTHGSHLGIVPRRSGDGVQRLGRNLDVCQLIRRRGDHVDRHQGGRPKPSPTSTLTTRRSLAVRSPATCSPKPAPASSMNVSGKAASSAEDTSSTKR